ncbi:MAG: hypothetical protein RR877_01070 [Aurantimicrobium sp.]|uniref:hypothetical protein n=1 Tax=Aurantimicrobium sp. TaxID=1930784 RepID=UPI002FC98269
MKNTANRFNKIIDRIKLNNGLNNYHGKKTVQVSLRLDRRTLLNLNMISAMSEIKRSKLMNLMLEQGVEGIIQKLPPDIRIKMEKEVREKLNDYASTTDKTK